jgi:hypothetical protein
VVVPAGRPPRSSQRIDDREQRRQAGLVGDQQRPVGRLAPRPVHARPGEADAIAGASAPRPRRRPPVVAVDHEVDVDLRARGVVRAHRVVAPVLVLRSAAREPPAAGRQHELLPGRRPAQRHDLARLLDAEVGELRRGERDPGRSLVGIGPAERA